MQKSAILLSAMLAACTRSGGFAPSTLGAPNAEIAPATANYKVLYSFQGSNDFDGSNPSTAVVALNGTFYGTTSFGGVADRGTAFALSPAGKERVLHSFGVNRDSADPSALLPVGRTFYATAHYEVNPPRSYGTVFRIDQAGSEHLIYAFKGSQDGAYPTAGLIEFNGQLFGTTSGGGGQCLSDPNNCGTVFAVTTSGRERVIYRFKGGTDGANPQASLAVRNGMLYGTTEYGGGTSRICRLGCGTVFAVTTSGKEQVLHAFQARGDGAAPFSSLLLVNGLFYGTTRAGGKARKGTVFEISPSGKERILYSFSGTGSAPQAALVLANGALYSTTSAGGSAGFGTVFKISTAGKLQVLHDFKGYPDGSKSYAPLLFHNGKLYGTTYVGGAFDRGSVFELTP
jgi:uncharacterized repeat protein (TIGR03803 family)